MTDTQGSVLDILIYLFDRYMLSDDPDVPERDELAQDLERAGFEQANVERALDWLADLATERERGDAGSTESDAPGWPAMRLFSDSELARLSTECRGYLLQLEYTGILSAAQREIVIDRLLALETEDLGVDQLKWVALMVLSSQPGAELACSRMEDLVWGSSELTH
jgi:Smg protein